MFSSTAPLGVLAFLSISADSSSSRGWRFASIAISTCASSGHGLAPLAHALTVLLLSKIALARFACDPAVDVASDIRVFTLKFSMPSFTFCYHNFVGVSLTIEPPGLTPCLRSTKLTERQHEIFFYHPNPNDRSVIDKKA